MTGERAHPRGLPAPATGVLRLDPLVATFRNVTNSYKHLWFRALLRAITRGHGPEIGFETLFRGLLEEAWWPAFHFRLHLGLQDQVVRRLDAVIADPDRLRWDTAAVGAAVADIPFDLGAERARGLLRHVPQRLIAPWFAEDLAGMPDGRVDTAIARLSRAPSPQRPLYRIEQDAIVLDPDWLNWFQEGLPIIEGWSDALWLDFLEARNPNVPGLVEKIHPTFGRESLRDQRVLWRAALATAPFTCIYTGGPLDPGRFALDHVLPRSFVAHDRLWNLTPIDPALNLAKRDRLPDLSFVRTLAFQHDALDRIADLLPEKPRRIWRRGLDERAIDLRLVSADRHHAEQQDQLVETYGAVFGALAGIAGQMGFQGGWRPSGTT